MGFRSKAESGDDFDAIIVPALTASELAIWDTY